MTFTGTIGTVCMFPLRAIIRLCVVLRIHPNLLTLIGVIINFLAAWQFAQGRFTAAGLIMLAANIFDFIDGKVAEETNQASRFGGFWDSVMDRFSDLSLFIGVMSATNEPLGLIWVIGLHSLIGAPSWVGGRSSQVPIREYETSLPRR